MSFEDDLESAGEAPIEYTDVPILLNGNLHTLRFLQLVGSEWADEADKHPARPGVLLDAQYGYNIRKLAKAIAVKTGRRVEADGSLTELTVDQWATLFKAIDGNTQGRIDDAIWMVNEIGPLQRVNAKKAGSAAASDKTSE